MKTSFDVFGNIVVMKFPIDAKDSDKVKEANRILSENKNVTTVLEKSEKIKGRLRKMKTEFLAGENTKITRYIENGCVFEFDVDETYFSPRLSNERKEIAEKIKKGDKVLVMFAGVGPFSVVIAKKNKNAFVISNELNRKATEFAKENVKLNKLTNMEVVQGDSRKVAIEYFKKKKKFDKIVMPRPNLKDNFLDAAFKIVRKNGEIYYYGFGDNEKEIVDEIKVEARRAKKQVKILSVKKAGDIAPYKFRWRVDLKVFR